jgi:hypothetical protein
MFTDRCEGVVRLNTAHLFMKTSYLCLGLFALLFCVACGTNTGGVTGFIPKGTFSNASLNGQYVYQIEGFDFSNLNNPVPYREAGVFTANGNQVITSATDDFSEGTGVFTTVSTGSYSISNDGTGFVKFNNALLGTITLEVTMVSASKVYMVEADTLVNAGGLAEKQDLTAITAAPSGTFVFREHDLNVSTQKSAASVGAFTLAGGVAATGKTKLLISANVNLISGSFNASFTSTGRGSLTFTDSALATSSFNYYIVDANNIRFLAGTTNFVGSGRAELQSGTPALSGSYAFGSKGDTASLSGVNMAGRFTASGGTITSGARDSVQDGNPATNVSFTGTFTQAASGRALVSLTTAANSNLVVWMVNPARGLFLVNDPSTVQDGSLDLQQVSSFSNSTMNGQFGFVMDGFDLGGAKDRVGTLQWDGSGKLILNEFSSAAGSPNSAILSGNYSVSANGRTGASISTISNNLIFYLVSGNDAYIVQNDSGVELNGTISKQQ